VLYEQITTESAKNQDFPDIIGPAAAAWRLALLKSPNGRKSAAMTFNFSQNHIDRGGPHRYVSRRWKAGRQDS